MRGATDELVQRFHDQVVALVKKYQFRDRNQMTCCGVSVSQCYVVEALHRHGPQTMNQLADRMCLSLSTMTRVVEQLVRKGMATREQDASDRRYRLIRLTPGGERVFRQAWGNVLSSERAILAGFPAQERELLVRLLSQLNRAVEQWRSCCSRR